MHRIDTPNATPDHRFTEGDPTAPTHATEVSAAFLNDLQENVCQAIEAAGIPLAKGEGGQLAQAILALIAAQAVSVAPASTTEAGIVERATPEEVIAGLDTERYVCPADLMAALLAGLAGVARVGAVNAYTRQQYPARVDRAAASGNQAVDCDLHQALGLTATGNLVMSTPTNIAAEKEVRLRIYAASAFTIGWATGWAGTTLVPLPTATVAGKWMHLTFVGDDATTLALVGYSVRA